MTPERNTEEARRHRTHASRPPRPSQASFTPGLTPDDEPPTNPKVFVLKLRFRRARSIVQSCRSPTATGRQRSRSLVCFIDLPDWEHVAENRIAPIVSPWNAPTETLTDPQGGRRSLPRAFHRGTRTAIVASLVSIRFTVERAHGNDHPIPKGKGGIPTGLFCGSRTAARRGCPGRST